MPYYLTSLPPFSTSVFKCETKINYSLIQRKEAYYSFNWDQVGLRADRSPVYLVYI